MYVCMYHQCTVFYQLVLNVQLDLKQVTNARACKEIECALYMPYSPAWSASMRTEIQW